jgi:hypothetical protein
VDKRLLVVLSTVGVAAVVAGLSAAETTSSGRNGSAPPRAQAVTPPKQATAAPRTAANGSISGPVSSNPQNGRDTADYWTKQRMQDARPVEKTVPGADASSSSPTVTTASEPATAAPARSGRKKTSTKKTAAAGPEGGPTGSPVSGDASEYWTKERMDNAAPQEKVVPGGSGSGESQGPTPIVEPAPLP